MAWLARLGESDETVVQCLTEGGALGEHFQRFLQTYTKDVL